MAPFQWRSELSLDIPEIDQQHQELVARARDLHDAMDLEKPTDELLSLLSVLMANAEAHFRSEEEMMLAHGYEGRVEHASKHARLLEQVALIKQEISSGQMRVGQPLLLFIQVWTEKHILKEDARFAAFLKSKMPS